MEKSVQEKVYILRNVSAHHMETEVLAKYEAEASDRSALPSLPFCVSPRVRLDAMRTAYSTLANSHVMTTIQSLLAFFECLSEGRRTIGVACSTATRDAISPCMWPAPLSTQSPTKTPCDCRTCRQHPPCSGNTNTTAHRKNQGGQSNPRVYTKRSRWGVQNDCTVCQLAMIGLMQS